MSFSGEDFDDSAVTEDVSDGAELCLCQKLYEEAGNQKKVLYMMCVGLRDRDGNSPLFCLETVPWLQLPKTASLRPKNTDFCNEVARRATLFNVFPLPRPSNWTRQLCMEWLQQNPVCDEADIEFLTKEVARVRDILVRAQQQQQQSELMPSTVSTGGGRSWRGVVPYLRVIMCLTQDHVKSLFLTRANVLTRQELDGRRNENRPKTVFEVISELWNSPDYNPVAPASECHVDYVSATVCSYEQVQALTPATPQKIQDIFASMRSDLLRIISRWEQSGQGEGGMDEEVDDENAGVSLSGASSVSEDDENQHHGSLARRPAHALQTRAAFLNGRPSYLLYFWEVADRHQLLQSSLQRLSNGTGASDASCAVSTAHSSSGASSLGRRKRKRRYQDDTENDEESSTLLPLVQSIQELTACQRQLWSDRNDDRLHEQQLNQRRQATVMREQQRERIFRRKAELNDIARSYRKLDAELDPNDERSSRLSNFYVNECLRIENEIRSLELETFNDSD